MRILITSIVDPMNSAYSRIHAIAEYLSERHEVTILSVRDKWKGSQKSSMAHRTEFAEMLSRTRLTYLTEGEKSIAYQEIHAKKLVKRWLKDANNPEYDLILDYNTISLGYQASKFLKGVPRIFDLADDLRDMIRISTQLPALLSPIATFIAGRRISKGMAGAQLIVATCTQLLEAYNVPSQKRRIIPNGVPTNFLEPVPESEMIDGRIRPGEFLIGYVGVLREWLDFKTVLKAMSMIKERIPIRLMIIGEEGGSARIKEMAEEMEVENLVTMMGTIPHDRIKRHLAACDCGIIPFKPMKTTEYALPLKLFEYFSAGIPVISSPIGPIKNDFEDVVSFYRDERELMESIDRIKNNKKDSDEKVDIARKKISQRYTWEKICIDYDLIIQDLARIIDRRSVIS